MPATPEAVRLNLDYYRKQAKALLKSARAGDAATVETLARHSARFDPAVPKLHDAQLAVARELGFPSWPRFRSFVMQSRLDDQGLVRAFISAAVSDRRRAEDILAAHPEVANGGFYAALVLGDWKQAEAIIGSAPELASLRGGPENLDPLVYVCFSRYAQRNSARAGDLVETARALLRHGANPNAYCIPNDLPDNPLSCLYGATGLNNNPSLARVLLEAGANPNDGESLYHSTEHGDLECMKLLLQHGANAASTNVLKHMLDREDREGVQVLLAAGADPNETNPRGETALHWAVWRGRTAPIVAALLDHGADPNARRGDGQTAYALAVQSGATEVAQLLAARGAETALSPLDRFLEACASAPPEELDRLVASAPQLSWHGRERLLADMTMIHSTVSVRALLAVGMPVDARGEHGGTALHWACWKGYADLVDLLLKHGASLTIEDHQFHGTPAGWFGHGAQNHSENCGDYAGVARLLIAAGATIPAADLPTGRPEVDAILRENGLI